jgi:ribosomal-protein-alanine N-acetyltransferase
MSSLPSAAAIRLAPGNSGDLAAVMAIMNAAFSPRFGEAWTRSQCAGILPMTGVSLMLAHDNGDEEPIGFSLFRTVAGEAELLLLAVKPGHQRRGVGRLLLDQFVESARRAGASRVHLEVRDGNPAVEMYRLANFTRAGRRPNYYRGSDGRQFDALTLAREL